jgi:hypothetical protein
MKFISILLTSIISLNIYSSEVQDFCKSSAASSLYLDETPAIFLKDENATLTLGVLKRELRKDFESNCKLDIPIESIISRTYDSCYKRAKSGFAEPHLMLVNRECDAGYRVAEAFVEARKIEKEGCNDKNAISNLKRAAKDISKEIPESSKQLETNGVPK